VLTAREKASASATGRKDQDKDVAGTSSGQVLVSARDAGVVRPSTPPPMHLLSPRVRKEVVLTARREQANDRVTRSPTHYRAASDGHGNGNEEVKLLEEEHSDQVDTVGRRASPRSPAWGEQESSHTMTLTKSNNAAHMDDSVGGEKSNLVMRFNSYDDYEEEAEGVADADAVNETDSSRPVEGLASHGPGFDTLSSLPPPIQTSLMRTFSQSSIASTVFSYMSRPVGAFLAEGSVDTSSLKYVQAAGVGAQMTDTNNRAGLKDMEWYQRGFASKAYQESLQSAAVKKKATRMGDPAADEASNKSAASNATDSRKKRLQSFQTISMETESVTVAYHESTELAMSKGMGRRYRKNRKWKIDKFLDTFVWLACLEW
jgi:hypothetical protein